MLYKYYDLHKQNKSNSQVVSEIITEDFGL